MGNILAYIGNTPVIRLNRVTDDGCAVVWAKLENLNPSGSIKDRVALHIIEKAEKRGDISPRKTKIVEATSGNTGIALALVCSVKGYRLKLYMPENASRERKEIVRALGADIAEIGGDLRMIDIIETAKRDISESSDDCYFIDQFNNQSGKKAHEINTASELIDQIPGDIDALVVGVGTGGTISGLGERLRKEYKNIRIYAVEPEESPVLSGGKPGEHSIEGIGTGFVPSVLNTEIYDEVIRINSSEAKTFTNHIVKKEGIFTGISSGASCLAAARIAARLGRSKNVVTIFFDTGERYLSTGLFL